MPIPANRTSGDQADQSANTEYVLDVDARRTQDGGQSSADNSHTKELKYPMEKYCKV